ncbi:hypothetical protein D3C78_814040 [compost metagenome]
MGGQSFFNELCNLFLKFSTWRIPLTQRYERLDDFASNRVWFTDHTSLSYRWMLHKLALDLKRSNPLT